MFKKSYVYFHKSSASALIDNLYTYNDGGDLICGIAHKNTVDILMGPETTQLSYRKLIVEEAESERQMRVNVVAIGAIRSGENLLLGVLKEKAFFLYASDGSEELGQVPCGDVDCQSGFNCFSSIGNCILIGTSDGEIKLISITDDSSPKFRQSESKILFRNVQAHSDSVVCVSGDGDVDNCLFVSADENYCVKAWKLVNEDAENIAKLQILSKYEPIKSDLPQNAIESDSCPTVMKILNHSRVCAVGDTHGRLLLVNLETGRLLVEVSAHARLITGLAIQKTNSSNSIGQQKSQQRSDLLVSVSEDSICRIWNVGIKICPGKSGDSNSDKPAASISLLQSIIVPDQMLQGVTFTNRPGNEFVISSFDSNETVSFVQI